MHDNWRLLRTFFTIFAFVIIVIRANLTLAGDVGPYVGEYCLTEYFNASCPVPGDVILMTSAHYGRMRVGRCIHGDYNIGCSNDVIELFDAQCSGRKTCNVSVRTLVDVRPCQRDFASYLEAAYTCVSVFSSVDVVSSCPTPDGAVVTTNTAVGYLGNDHLSNDFPRSVIGSQACPWLIRANPGQRIQLGMITLGPPSVETSGGGVVQLAACPKIAVIETQDGSLSSGNANGGGKITQQHEYNVCIRKTRERLLYSSTGHDVTVYVTAMTSSTHEKSLGVFDDQEVTVPDMRFLLFYKPIGCPQLVLSSRAWVKNVQGNDVMIRCNDTMQTWYISCHGNRWVGRYDNCTGEGKSTKMRVSAAVEQYMSHSGLMLALGLGLLLGVAIAATTLTAVCCWKQFGLCRKHRCTAAKMAAKSGAMAASSSRRERCMRHVTSSLPSDASALCLYCRSSAAKLTSSDLHSSTERGLFLDCSVYSLGRTAVDDNCDELQVVDTRTPGNWIPVMKDTRTIPTAVCPYSAVPAQETPVDDVAVTAIVEAEDTNSGITSACLRCENHNQQRRQTPSTTNLRRDNCGRYELCQSRPCSTELSTPVTVVRQNRRTFCRSGSDVIACSSAETSASLTGVAGSQKSSGSPPISSAAALNPETY